MKFSFISLFDDIIKNYFKHSILANAIKNNYIEIETHNLRDFSQNKHKSVDDTVYGGGNGQLLNVEPLVESLKPLSNSHIIFVTPVGKKFTQKDAKRLSKKNHITFVCGRYEGFDERAIELMANEVLSIGDYILTGGELASLSMCDAISRCV
jgi:tRNA (guanine37-N1)-methyltransferase